MVGGIFVVDVSTLVVDINFHSLFVGSRQHRGQHSLNLALPGDVGGTQVADQGEIMVGPCSLQNKC